MKEVKPDYTAAILVFCVVAAYFGAWLGSYVTDQSTHTQEKK